MPAMATDSNHQMELLTTSQCHKSSLGAVIPPFPLLLGEQPILVCQSLRGQAMVTSYRLCVTERYGLLSVPLMSVQDMEMLEPSLRIRLGCKHGATYSCNFASLSEMRACFSTMRDMVGLPRQLSDLFAYRFYTAVKQHEAGNPAGTSSVHAPQSEVDQVAMCRPVSHMFAYSFGKEVERLGFDTNRRRIWRMSHANENYEFCPTYPKLHLLPASVSDDKLKDSLDFRAIKRFPSVVWRDKGSGMVLIRSSQPMSSFLGVSYFSNDADLLLLNEIVKACNRDYEALQAKHQTRLSPLPPSPPTPGEAFDNPGLGQGHNGGGGAEVEAAGTEGGAQGGLVAQGSGASNGQTSHVNGIEHPENHSPRKLAIVDCRSNSAVWGNSFKGGGTEDEAVYRCKLIHLDLANIHAIRDSFKKLRDVCYSYPDGSYLKQLSGSNWLSYISQLLRGANIVVELMACKRRPVLVHCSDGWDRTSQICALSELLMDPYYRTTEGFQVLVEREWLHFGHKFAERGGHDPKCSDTNQVSPIFVQFLDCVHQLQEQNPAEFEFNEAYLIKLLKHSQACLFGTFLHNNCRERELCRHNTASVWTLLQPGNSRFQNLLYRPRQEVLLARSCEHDLDLWRSVYMEGHSSMPDLDLEPLLSEGSGNPVKTEPLGGTLTRTRSMDELHRANGDGGRRLSDPAVTAGLEAASAECPADPHNTSSSSAEFLHCPDDIPSQMSSRLVGLDINGRNSPSTSCNGHQDPKKREGLTSESKSDSGVSSAGSSCPSKGGEDAEGFALTKQDKQETASDRVVAPLSVLAQDSVASLCAANGELHKDMQCAHNGDSDSSTSKGISESIIADVGPDAASDSNVNGNGENGLTNGESKLSVERESSSGTTNGRKSEGNNHSVSLLSERLAGGEMAGQENGVNKHVNNASQCNGHVNSSTSSPQGNPDLLRDLDTSRSHVSAAKRNLITSENSTTQTELTLNTNTTTINGTNNTRQSTSEPHTIPNNTTSSSSSQHHHHHHPTLTHTLNNNLQQQQHSKDNLPQEVTSSPSSSLSSMSSSSATVHCKPSSTSSSSSITLTSPVKKDMYLADLLSEGSPSSSNNSLLSRRHRAASGASRDLSRDLSISPSPGSGNWTDTGRLRHPSGSSSEAGLRTRAIRTTVSTSTTDISDSCVGQIAAPSLERQPSIRQHMDVDGLTLTSDPRQELLTSLLQAKDQKIRDLEQMLNKATEVIRRQRHLQASPQLGGTEDMLMSDSEGGEPSSLVSNQSLDSWENVDETEAKVVPWVPDHIVTHCAGCDAQFWAARWKHHCRNCGKVFCDECTNYRAPVPLAHLNKLERVCHRCHATLMQLSPGASSDGRIPTLVADG